MTRIYLIILFVSGLLLISIGLGLLYFYSKKKTPETTKTTESEKPKNDNIATMDLAPGIATMDLDFSKMNLDFSNFRI